MKKTTLIALAVTLGLGAASTYAAPPAKEQVCRTCHGEGGNKTLMPTYPKIGGQNKEYLVQVLQQYKKGERKGGLAQLMTAQAGMLSDADIQALAEYYSSQP